MASANKAAWQDSAGIPLSIRPTPHEHELSSTQLLVRSQAWGINPADYIVQDTASLPFITYPLILGEDICGTIVSVGASESSRFKPGDRVLAIAMGSARGKPEMGGFQEYVVVEAAEACRIPDTMR
ncbi:MAG: hypothetical protein Q9170_008399, partial [Blastenia crenularia]